MVYKLVEIDNISKIKFSADIFKATLPGKKTIFRVWVKGSNYPTMDIITFDNEKIEENK